MVEYLNIIADDKNYEAGHAFLTQILEGEAQGVYKMLSEIKKKLRRLIDSEEARESIALIGYEMLHPNDGEPYTDPLGQVSGHWLRGKFGIVGDFEELSASEEVRKQVCRIYESIRKKLDAIVN